MRREARAAYWRANLRSILAILAAWVALSFGAGILLADPLDAATVAGFPLGFWFANQGSLVGFVALVFIYVWRMNRLDHRFDVYEE
jgi:putative solute:sodium symporter small subunit